MDVYDDVKFHQGHLAGSYDRSAQSCGCELLYTFALYYFGIDFLQMIPVVLSVREKPRFA